jgi:hypothetical protein
MKKRQVKCLGKDIYTLSDPRESNEELSKVCFENLLKTPKLLDMRSRSDLIRDYSIPQLPRWHDRHFKVHKCKVWFGISCSLHTFGIHVSP